MALSSLQPAIKWKTPKMKIKARQKNTIGMYRVGSNSESNDMEWRWITWRKPNSNNYWASHAREEERYVCAQHCYYVLREKTVKFCYYYAHTLTHTYLSVYPSIYRQQKCGNENIFFEKFLKKILIPRINCSDTKYIHVSTWDSGQARWPMRALWLHGIKKLKFHLNWVGYWNFVSARVRFPSWWTCLASWSETTTMTWKFPLHKMSFDYWAHSMEFDWPIVLLRLFISNVNHSKSVCHDFKQFPIDGVLKCNNKQMK